MRQQHVNKHQLHKHYIKSNLKSNSKCHGKKTAILLNYNNKQNNIKKNKINKTEKKKIIKNVAQKLK